MPTQLQRESSRRNAERSTGPRTPLGRARSAINAFKTGIYAESAILEFWRAPTNSTCSPPNTTTAISPPPPKSAHLVDTLVRTEWLRRRMEKVEAQAWHAQMCKNAPRRRLLPRDAWLQASTQFARLQNRLNSLHRTYLSTLNALETLEASHLQTSHPAEISTTQSAESESDNPFSASFRQIAQPASGDLVPGAPSPQPPDPSTPHP